MSPSSSIETSIVFITFLRVLYIAIIIVIPVVLIQSFWSNWVAYVRAKFFANQKYVLLELKIPKIMTKSPLAMEIFINSLFQPGGEGTWMDKYIKGSVRSWFSLEIASVNGSVRFFIWAKEKFKDMIETNLYSQYPDIEIADVTDVDYTKLIPYDPTKYQYWGCEFKKSEVSHLPIKTYVDYGLSEDQKEEYKIDPITPVIEFLGSLRKGENVWFQICIRAHTKDQKKPDTWFDKVDWKYFANEDIKKRTKRDLKIDKEKPMNPALMSLTQGEKAAVEAIEKSIAKVPFDCAIRAVYVATLASYRSTTQAGISGALRPFGAQNLNSFKAHKAPEKKHFWHSDDHESVISQRKKLFELFRNRAFFYNEYIPRGYKGDYFVMNTEELATVFHFPGDVARTPSLSRVSAKKVEPPSNLPI